MDRQRLSGYLVSGGLWIGLFVVVGLASAGFSSTILVLALYPAIFVLVGSVALALSASKKHDDRVLTILWACLVAALTLVSLPAVGVLAPIAGVLVGTVSFSVWVGPAYVLTPFFPRGSGANAR